MKNSIIYGKNISNIYVGIKIGETFIPTGGTIPTVKISICDIESREEILPSGYLSPFRRYCFQVSGNEGGEYDMGSSPALSDMRPILGLMSENDGKIFLNGQAALAVQAFIPSYTLGEKVLVENFSYKYLPKYYRLTSDSENVKNWSNFIDMCYKWILTGGTCQ